jgi:uncharacterized protein (DUF4415 family)
MPGEFVPLTDDELAYIRRRRLEAAERALRKAEEMTDEEDAALTPAAEADPDNPPLTDEQWGRMRPAHEVHPEFVAKWLRRKRGRPPLESPKKQVTLRLDQDVIEHFRSGGPGWQSCINEALRRAVGK